MKLYGYILLFLIVLMTLTSNTEEGEHFNIFSDIVRDVANAATAAGKGIHNGVVISEAAVDVTLETTKYANDAVKAAGHSNSSISDAVQQARNMNDYLGLMKTRVNNCAKIATDAMASAPVTHPIADCEGLSKHKKLLCKVNNGRAHSKNAFNGASHLIKTARDLKTNYKTHLESPECATERKSIQARAAGGEIISAKETLAHLRSCNQCANNYSLQQAIPLDSGIITDISNNAEATLSSWPSATPTLNTLRGISQNLET